jgi:hypothetical protein
MSIRNIQLIDSHRAALATAQVEESGGLSVGAIDLNKLSPQIVALFREFEDAVNNQLFSDVDRLQDAIDALAFRARFDDGSESLIADLQVFPSTGEFSFRLASALPARADWNVTAVYPKGELRS